MSNFVFVLDANKQPLEPCTPGMARSLLKAGKAAVFKRYPLSVLKRVLAQAKAPLKVRNAPSGKLLSRTQENLADAAAVNATRWKLLNSLKGTGLLITTGTGSQTKFNRSQQTLKKTHWLDAACVGDTPRLEILTNQPLLIKCIGHSNRQVIHVNKFGFPRKNKANQLVRKSALVKSVKGFQTGDIVKAIVTKGKKVGSYLGKVAIRTSGSFNIKTVTETVQGVNHKYCSIVQKKDGYTYGF